MDAPRPLPLKWIVLSLLVGYVLLEVAVSRLYAPPTELLNKVVAYEKNPNTGIPDVVVVGTCLSEQVLNYGAFRQSMENKYEPRHLGTAASTVADWYLVAAHHIPAKSDVAGLVIAFGRHDLLSPINPWESQVMELAEWGDIPLLARVSCRDLSCKVGVFLRKLSPVYRYRYRLARHWWGGGGGLPQGAQPAASPGQEASRPKAELGEFQQPLNDDAAPLLLDRILFMAKERNIPVFLVMLPSPPTLDSESIRYGEATRKLLEPFLATGEVTYIELKPAALTADMFQDAAHVTGPGSQIVGRELGTILLPLLESRQKP